jgi:hypothetical protein
VEVRWSEDGEEHIARHGVSPAEVEEAVSDHRALRRKHRGRSVVLAQTDNGRRLTIVVEFDGTVVTAREMTDGERRTYERRGK